MTITFGPAAYAPAHFDLFYVVTDAKASDPVTYTNYKYVADIYINGTMVTRLKRFPNPDNGYGVFNITAIVRDYLTTTFAPINTFFTAMDLGPGEFVADIVVKFGEEYGITTTYNIVTDITRQAYNYYLRLPQGSNAPLINFTNKIATNGYKGLNELTTLKATLSTDYLFVSYFNTAGTGNIPILFTCNGGTYDNFLTPATNNNMLVVNIAPTLLNAFRTNSVISSTEFYTVKIGDTDTIRVNMFCEAIHKVYPVHFLNQYGGFETVLMNKLSRQNIKVDRKSFGTLPYRVFDNGTVGYRDGAFTYFEANYNYATTFNNTLTLNSDILTDKEYIWLEDLIESPLIYVQMNGFFYPVKITTTDYEIKKSVNETDLNNLTITLDLGRTFNSQFR